MNTRVWKYSLLALAVSGMLAVQARAQAADGGGGGEGPVIITKAARPSYLTLDPIHGALGVSAIYQQQSVSNQGQSAHATDTLFTEQLTLGTSGSIVSRNIFNWSATGTVSLEEEQSSQSPGVGGSQSQFGVFNAYDLSADILSATIFPSSVYARRSEYFVNRAFASLLRDTTSEYGGVIRYNSPAIPTSLSLSHSTTTQSDLAGNSQFSTDQNQLNVETSFQPTDRQQLALNFSYTEVTQNNPGVLNTGFENTNASLMHNWTFDREGRYVLSSNFNYSQQSGQFPITQMHITEQLRLRHTDYFETNYSYKLNDQEDARSQLLSHMVSAGFTHRLYQSLVTTGGVSMMFNNTTFNGAGGLSGGSASSQNFTANIGTSYTKQLWLGHLGANLSLGYSQDDNSSIGQPQQILNDIHSFADPQPITLIRPGLDSSSIVVLSADGTRRFVQGTDYTVRTFGNTVQVLRTLGGNINDGDTVRLNYLLDPLPGYTSRAASLGAGANYAFEEGPLKGLNLFARYFQIDQTISPANSLIRPDDVRDTVLGAEYRVWKLTLRAEDQMHDSTLAPYDALRFSARYVDRWGDRTTASLSATQNFITYPQQDSRNNFTTVDGQLEYQIQRDLRAILTARWRNDEDTRLGTTVGLEEQAELRWKIRQTDVYFMLRHTNLDAAGTNSDSLLMQLGITRNF